MMDDDTNYEGQDHYHEWLEGGRSQTSKAEYIATLFDRTITFGVRGACLPTLTLPPTKLGYVVKGDLTLNTLQEVNHTINTLVAPPCTACGSDDTHQVHFGVDDVEAYSCMGCGNVTATIYDEPVAANDDEPEVECAVDPDAKILVNYTILDNGFPVGTATDKEYHHHISIPYLGFETVKENIKNWAVETGHTLEVTG